MIDLNTPFGSQGRVGLILPADNVAMEPEVYSLNIPGVSFNTLRLTATNHHEMRKQAAELSSTIYELGLDIIVYACAETSFNDGADTSERLTDILTQKSNLPIITATQAMLAALNQIHASKLAVLSPYTQKSGTDLESTLASKGYSIAAAQHHDFFPDSGDSREWYATNRQPKNIVLKLLTEMNVSAADTILLPATNWPTLDAITQIESTYGLPVVSSNQSIIWWALNQLGLPTDNLKLGKLGEKVVSVA